MLRKYIYTYLFPPLRVFTVLGVFVFTYFNLSAQTDSTCTLELKGKIYDCLEGTPLPGAVVFIRETGQGTAADAEGHYKIKSVCKGIYTVVYQAVGYKTIERRENLDQNLDRNIILHAEATELREVTVVGKGSEAPIHTTSTLEGAGLDALRGKSLGEALKSITGITTLQTGPSISKPVIHGMQGNRIVVMNNGVRLEGQQWGSEHAPEIDPFLGKKITVVKGAAGVRYGAEAIGGVVLIEPGDLPTSSGISGEINTAVFSNNFQGVMSGIAEGLVSKKIPISWRVQGTYKRAGDSKAPDYYINNTGLRETNFSGALGYKREKFGIDIFYSRFQTVLGVFRGSHIGNLTDLQNAIALGRPAVVSNFSYAIGRPYQDIRHDLLRVNANYTLGKFGDIRLILAHQANERSEFDAHKLFNNPSEDTNRPQLSFNLSTYTMDVLLNHNLSPSVKGTFGVNLISQRNITYGFRLIPNFRSFTGGAYMTEEWRKNKFLFEAGLRYDYKWIITFLAKGDSLYAPEFNFHNVSGTIGTSYRPDEHRLFKLNVATAWRAPSVSELLSNGVHHGTASYEKGSMSLKSEIAYNSNLSASFTGGHFRGDFNVYMNYINNYIWLAPKLPPVLTIRGAFPSFQYEQTNAVLAGCDVSLQYRFLKSMTWLGKISYLNARKTDGEFLPFMPPVRAETSLRYTLERLGKLEEAFLSLGALFVGKQNNIDPTKDYAPPPDAYFLLNAEAGFLLPVGKERWTIGLSVENMLNTRYRDYTNRFRYFTDEIGTNVSLRLKVPFDF